MRYTQHALFREPTEAEAAVDEIHSAGLPEGEYRLVVHKGGLDEDDLVHSESDARGGFISGVLIGFFGGALLGALLAGPFALLPVGILTGALVCAVVGVVIGGLGASLYGAGLTNPTVKRLAKRMHEGRVLVTAETNSLDAREAIEQIIRRHGAVPA
jgi:hypothetical protein